MLNVLNVNYTERDGAQFNNFAARKKFESHGICHRFMVLFAGSDDASVQVLAKGFLSRVILRLTALVESLLSVQSLLHITPLKLAKSRAFQQADIIHYHIIHSGYFSLMAMPWLSRKKPSIWTIHDPWLFTGHCIHPIDCDGWLIGCGHCPHLDRFISLRQDRSRWLFSLKKRWLARSNIQFIVASKWMQQMAARSPIGKNLNIKVIPFGIDLEQFRLRDASAMRRKLYIAEENIVLFCRGDNSEVKGTQYIHSALPAILQAARQPVTLLTVGVKGLFDSFIGQCQIVEMGWQSDLETMSALYNVADIFLMPSVAESFGLMAVEAMACEKPVVCFKGTSVEEVVHAPKAGVSVERHDASALANAVIDLMSDAQQRDAIGKAARKVAQEQYDVKHYVAKLSDVYQAL